MKSSHAKLLFLTGLVIVLMTVSHTAAASVEVKLIKPEKYRDIEQAGFSQKKSIEVINKDVQKFFDSVATSYIPESNKLLIEVTDIDLPGRVEYMVGPNFENIRILRSDDIFKLYFNYKLIDKNGKVVKEGEEKLRDYFNQNTATRLKKIKTFAHFNRKLSKWFEQNFSQL